ncbi:MAG: SurA N-terminal domain-containing protein [Thermodesulfobacteriota bacterium]
MMLRNMRKNASSWVIKILLSLIVLAFIFTGVGTYQAEKANRLGLVNGETLLVSEYRDTYQNLIEQLRQRYGNNLNSEMLEMLQVKKQALDRLIGQKLILQEAQKRGLIVGDEELAETIRGMGIFNEAGEFSQKRYDRMLSRVQMSPEIFETKQREAMLADKLQTLITDNVKVTEKEAHEWFNWLNAEVNLDVVSFQPDQYKDIVPAEEEINNYYKTNKEKYKTDSMVKAGYIRFAAKDYLDKVSVSEAELKDYYTENRKRYETPKTVEARHILLRLDANAPAALVEEKRAKAQEIANQARQPGQDFAKLAREFTEEPNKENGGFLKAFRREEMVAPFSDKAFSMQVDEISDPVRTQFGWHVIKVEKINEKSEKTFEAVQEEIRKTVTDEKAKALAYEEAEAVFEISIEGDDLEQSAKERSLALSTTDYFTAAGPKEGVPDRLKFARAAFDLPEKGISDVLELQDGYYILQVQEKVPSKTAEYADVKETVTADLKKELQDAKASAEADQFFQALTAEPGSFAAESGKRGLEVISTGFFKREGTIPRIGMEESLAEAAFNLSAEEPRPKQVIRGQMGYYIIQLKERRISDTMKFDAEKKKLMAQLTVQKKNQRFSKWLAQLREKSDITIQEGLL